MPFNFTKHAVTKTPQEVILLVSVYELGKVFECLYDDIDMKAKDVFGMTELADFISMLRMICEQHDWDFESLVGEELDDRTPRKDILAQIMINHGKMIRSLYYFKLVGDYRGLKADTCMVLVISNVRKLCHCMKWDFYSLMTLGESRYLERMEDLAAHADKNLLLEK